METTGSGATESAKEVLDKIGKQVYDKVHGEADNLRNELSGHLRKATFSNKEKVQTEKPCDLNYEYHTYVTSTVIDPCERRSDIRFSDDYGGQCTFNRIRDSTNNGVGACAPFRRLHVCDRNLEQIKPHTITATDNLLLDVCMAAKFEGRSVSEYYRKYQAKYDDPGSTICTVLARSFADIGDIIRGKDLYRGDKKVKDKLEKKLKQYFKNIYDNLGNQYKDKAEARYKKKDDPHFYQLREDWWERNRRTVWKAMTCEAGNAKYFRATCGEESKPHMTPKQCRCEIHDVPTYFDYVPQYLRWFEEWAEDFCRKRKHKLENAKNICRGDDDSKYCSRNGFDCTQTIRGKRKLFKSEDCTKCSLTCTPFVNWIDNQKLEFDKQRKKYTEEIGKTERTNETAITIGDATINNLYIGEFYNLLKKQYPSDQSFLELLSKEPACKNHPTVKNKNTIDFEKDKPEEIFSHTEYCDTCPWCATKKKQGGGKWEDNPEGDCKDEQMEDPDENEGAEINLLVKNNAGTNIVEKLGSLCNNAEKNYDSWKCYYEGNKKDNGDTREDYCILKNKKKGTEERTIMPFDAFFSNWIDQMLKDSIEWRKEIDNCLKNNKNTCGKNKCNNDCKCFKAWVEQKEKEWQEIEKHYEEEDFGPEVKPYVILEYNLQNSYFPIVENKYPNEKPVKEMKEIMKENMEQVNECTKKNNSINDFLQKEKEEAQKCENAQNECKKQREGEKKTKTPTKPTIQGRSEAGDEQLTQPLPEESGDEEEDEDEEEDLEEDNSSSSDSSDTTPEETRTDQETTKVQGPEQTEVSPKEEETPSTVENVCSIVDGVLTKSTNLQDACAQKYSGNNARLGWKCIPTKNSTTGTASGDAKSRPVRSAGSVEGRGAPTTSSDSNGGGICVPPRRRKMYIQPIEKWVEETTVTSADEAQTEAQTEPSDSNKEAQKKQLLEAFVQSAAIETWFLWDRYKKENTKNRTTVGGVTLPSLDPNGLFSSEDDENGDPEAALRSGTIPEEFLRQMFYTIADYRDIAVGNIDGEVETAIKRSFITTTSGNTETDKEKVAGSDKKDEEDPMDKIKKAIDKIITKNGEASTPSKPSTPATAVTSREELWKKYGEQIWNGMICALTYEEENSGTDGNTTITRNDTVYSNLWDTAKNQPKETQYQYQSVKIGGSDTTSYSSTTSIHGDATPLKTFIETPTFFRWLHEWGNEFCQKRTEMLDKIEVDCQVQNGSIRSNEKKPKCSCYGEHCEDNLKNGPTIVPSLLCKDCGKYCGFYKRWIGRKNYEFTKQVNAYTDQKKNCENGKECCGISGKTCDTAKYFLEQLGPCKGDSENGNSATKFDDTEKDKTFKPSPNCKPCSKLTVTCENGACNDDARKECSDNTTKNITADRINGSNGNIVMLVSDESTGKFEGDGLEQACTGADLFKGIKQNNYKCGKVCGYTVCKPENNSSDTHDDQIILLYAFATHWVRNFLNDYNKIKHQISHCTKKGDGSVCKNDCTKKCKCAHAWIEKKIQEWEDIKTRLIEQYKHEDTYYPLTAIWDEFKEGTAFKNAIHPCTVDKFKSSCGLKGHESVDNSNHKDLVECLLNKLEEKTKAHFCPDQSRDQPENQCDNSTPDDKEPELLEEEQKVEQPKFCPHTPTSPSEEPGETCADEEEEKEEEKDKGDEEEEGEEEVQDLNGAIPPAQSAEDSEENPVQDAVQETQSPEEKTIKETPPKPSSTPRRRRIPPKKKVETPRPFTLADMSSSFVPLTVGMGFLALSYWLLKRKPKPPVELFRVLDIPKGEFDMPTLKSKNRYIPYSSANHRGKRYIYIEGDTDDEKYIGDITSSDITSSSESEYEEMDLHVPSGPPKYKTLIEVVLEPSKRDIQNDLPSDDTPRNESMNDEEWNELKENFISQYLQNELKDMPNNLPDNSDNNTHPNTLYDNVDEKPFIMSIHDRNLYTGEEYNYDMLNSGIYGGSSNSDSLSGNNDPISDNHAPYSGIDLINDSLSGNHDIYDEILKRKENELFGTENKKHTTHNSFAKHTNTDPLMNQIDLFHKWLDRHRDMCQQWENNHERLDRLKEEWEKDTNSGNINPSGDNIPSDNIPSDIPNGELSDISNGKLSDTSTGKLSDTPNHNNKHSDIPYALNTDVSIQIDMDKPYQMENMNPVDQNPLLVENINLVDSNTLNPTLPYNPNLVENNTPIPNPTKVQIELSVKNSKMEEKENFPIGDVWGI